MRAGARVVCAEFENAPVSSQVMHRVITTFGRLLYQAPVGQPFTGCRYP